MCVTLYGVQRSKIKETHLVSHTLDSEFGAVTAGFQTSRKGRTCNNIAVIKTGNLRICPWSLSNIALLRTITRTCIMQMIAACCTTSHQNLPIAKIPPIVKMLNLAKPFCFTLIPMEQTGLIACSSAQNSNRIDLKTRLRKLP